MGFRFEDLDIWKLAIGYAGKVYEVTEQLPPHENFGLKQQIRRAAVSVSLNVAEGSGRGTKKDFSRFINMALGSVFEVVSGLAIALEREHINAAEYEEIHEQYEILAKKMGAFWNCLVEGN